MNLSGPSYAAQVSSQDLNNLHITSLDSNVPGLLVGVQGVLMTSIRIKLQMKHLIDIFDQKFQNQTVMLHNKNHLIQCTKCNIYIIQQLLVLVTAATYTLFFSLRSVVKYEVCKFEK